MLKDFWWGRTMRHEVICWYSKDSRIEGQEVLKITQEPIGGNWQPYFMLSVITELDKIFRSQSPQLLFYLALNLHQNSPTVCQPQLKDWFLLKPVTALRPSHRPGIHSMYFYAKLLILIIIFLYCIKLVISNKGREYLSF